jgi:hypothetical protein
MATSTQSFAGKIFVVSGFTPNSNVHGFEVFLGKAIDEPFGDNLAIEGKTITYNHQGSMSVKPFMTTIQFPYRNSTYQFQQLTHDGARNEAQRILTTNVTNIYRSTFPYLYRWIESSFGGEGHAPFGGGFGYLRNFGFGGYGQGTFARYGQTFTNPFFAFYQGFVNSAEHFRRILFQSPQINTTREMDKVTELEGNLTIELGRITNQTAVKFNQIVSRENELRQYFEAIHGFEIPVATNNYAHGWIYLMTRMQMAKSWGQRNGKTPLVREINGFVRESINSLNDVILEHCSTLDTLITETCTHYGISLEIFGTLSPFTNYTAPYAYTAETLDNTGSNLVGVG